MQKQISSQAAVTAALALQSNEQPRRKLPSQDSRQLSLRNRTGKPKRPPMAKTYEETKGHLLSTSLPERVAGLYYGKSPCRGTSVVRKRLNLDPLHMNLVQQTHRASSRSRTPPTMGPTLSAPNPRPQRRRGLGLQGFRLAHSLKGLGSATWSIQACGDKMRMLLVGSRATQPVGS